MESLGTGKQEAFSFLSRSSDSIAIPRTFFKGKNNIDNKKTGKMILPVFLLSIS
ncbi:hypothetical protein RJT13_05015 [Segatella copri]|uniref:hypothetical protein n=1 Tax=Segatella copri TaxID=165179 RepID=UPI002916964E|nr:hypothetical protein [Segatella copri]MDV3121016.1 hypothetical protein [Segatella copri]